MHTAFAHYQMTNVLFYLDETDEDILHLDAKLSDELETQRLKTLF
ncbi:hypothetical protein C4K35_5202 [Pseudomonas chlororaphis subsp. piscium]|nr:hypothetical protein C4K35_5202 [Pseudomonas chlororaphis subsp. piscium]